MPKKTVRGKFCSPLAESSGGGSCYTRSQLLHMIDAYNNKYSTSKQIKHYKGNTKEQLWAALDERMTQCNNEWCWLDYIDVDAYSAFRPKRPVGKCSWLSTTDIKEVLKQYEAVYPEFVFLGPVPLDFCALANNEVCKINIKSSLRKGITKIGIVFNTDPTNLPGKHWISMFLDISGPTSEHELSYFDSYGKGPLLPEIKTFIENLQTQNPFLKLKLNCNDEMCTHAIQHQQNNTECGVYSINFIVSRLTGESWEDITNGNRRTDKQMIELRKYYFRPTTGDDHIY